MMNKKVPIIDTSSSTIPDGESELNDRQLFYMYDIGRMSRPFSEVQKEMNDNIMVTFKGETTKLAWMDGLSYDRDLCEYVLPFVDKIVMKHVQICKEANELK